MEHDYRDVGVRVAPGDLQGRRKLGQRRSSCRSSDRVVEAIAGEKELLVLTLVRAQRLYQLSKRLASMA